MAEGKAGRPKVLLRRHVIEVKKETREWLDEKIEEVTRTYIIGKAARSSGEIIKGAVSHPVGFATIASLVGILALKAGFLKDEIAAIQEMVLGALGATREAGEDTRKALERAWCRFRVMVARPVIGEQEYENQMEACKLSSSPTEVERRLRSIQERQRRATMTAEEIAAESRERERIQRERGQSG